MAEFHPIPLKHFTFANIAFLKSASRLSECPDDKGIEIAFVGRSNAGKSSAINAITGRGGLARTSKTPGRTQLINFFELDPDRRLVDLPGYGFAKVPERIQRQIEEMLSTYLTQRQCLQGIVLLMDIRHPLTSLDEKLIDFLSPYAVPIHVLLTKSDKLKRGQSQATLLKTRAALGAFSHISVQTFSALSRIGVEEVHQKFDEWFHFG